jgi:hypothetical protein
MECKEYRSAIFCQISCHYIYHLLEGESTIFLKQKCYYIDENRKGQKVDMTQIIFNSLCTELDRCYRYVKDSKGDKKETCQYALILAKIFQYLFVHQKDNP